MLVGGRKKLSGLTNAHGVDTHTHTEWVAEGDTTVVRARYARGSAGCETDTGKCIGRHARTGIDARPPCRRGALARA